MRTVTDFMMKLHKELQDVRKIADQTASQYIRTLYNLNSERPFTNLAWLKNIDSVNLRLAEYAKSTQKTAVTTIVSSLSLFKDKPTYKKVYTYWYNVMMSNTADSRNEDTSVKTEKQKDNWLDWSVVKAHEQRLQTEVNDMGKDIVPSQWETILGMMVLSLYTEFAPRRNQDYQFMNVVKTLKQATQTDVNYIVLDSKLFVFNKYKTVKAHGQQEFPIPEHLMEIIKLYLSKHPLLRDKKPKGPVPFLVHSDGTPFTAVNSITRILNRIFGKKIGSTMLRHVYLSSKYDVKEMDDDAERMGHTSGVQHTYMKTDEKQEATIPTL